MTGCCLTASAETWRELGGFDPWYFLNFEDSELSVRARRRGIDLVVLPQAVIHHRVSASFVGSAAQLGTYYYARNGLRFVGMVLGGDLATRARFARAHLLPQIVGAARRGAVREALQMSIMVTTGAVHAALGHGGAATTWLEWRRPGPHLDQPPQQLAQQPITATCSGGHPCLPGEPA